MRSRVGLVNVMAAKAKSEPRSERFRSLLSGFHVKRTYATNACVHMPPRQGAVWLHPRKISCEGII